MSLPRDQRGISRDVNSPLIGCSTKKCKLRKSSTNDGNNLYTKPGFYENPTNQFWETGMYSEKTKDYFRNLHI